VNPDYLFSWVRDASLVFKTIIDQYTTGQDLSLRTLIDDFVSAEAGIQQVTNPSGTVVTGGLGEPKVSVSLPPNRVYYPAKIARFQFLISE